MKLIFLDLNEYVTMKDVKREVEEYATYYGGMVEFILINDGWSKQRINKLFKFIKQFDCVVCGPYK